MACRCLLHHKLRHGPLEVSPGTCSYMHAPLEGHLGLRPAGAEPKAQGSGLRRSQSPGPGWPGGRPGRHWPLPPPHQGPPTAGGWRRQLHAARPAGWAGRNRSTVSKETRARDGAERTTRPLLLLKPLHTALTSLPCALAPRQSPPLGPEPRR